MTALYKRSGISPAAQMVRWSKPLSLGGKFRQTGRMKSAARPAIWIGDLLLRLSDSRISWGNRWKVALQQGNCGDEFTALRRKLRTTSGIEVDRTAEYLNWRYLRHPSGEHQILTARESGELKGYLIFSCSGEKARIQEWGTENDAVLLPALVRALVRILRRTQIGNLNAFLLENDPRALILRKLGFWSRESSPVMLYWPETGAASAGDWLLMYGDRDI
jgi:hypothetical protein